MIEQPINTIEPKSMTLLPTTATTVNDLRNLVRFLKQKPNGISPLEVTDIFRRRLFEPCKLAAYKIWGIIDDSNGLIRLSPLGLGIGQGLETEARQYRLVLASIEPYRKALEWISEIGAEIVTHQEVTDFWNAHHPGVFPADDARTAENCVINFFHLCHSAELGIAAVGRKGQPTRLTTHKDEMDRFNFSSHPQIDDDPKQTEKQPNSTGFAATESAQVQVARLLVSCGEDEGLPRPLREILEITDVCYTVHLREKSEVLPSEESRKTMGDCRAAVIVTSENNLVTCNGMFRFSDSLLSEVITSYALFDTRVLILWRGKIPRQTPINGLRMALLPDEMDWCTAVELGRLLKDLKYTPV